MRCEQRTRIWCFSLSPSRKRHPHLFLKERLAMMPITILGHQYAMKKGYVTGTHRARSPRETLNDYLPLMSCFGITRLATVTGLDSIGLPVYTAIRPNSRSLATAQGKGFDADSAKVSALMESIETWHAEHIQKPLHWDSYWSLCESAAVANVMELQLRSDSKLRLDLPQLWIEGYDLVQQPTFKGSECPGRFFG